MTGAGQDCHVSAIGRYTMLRFDRIAIDEGRILRIQGYRDPDKIRPVIKRAAADAARETESLVRATACYRMAGIRRCADGILELDDGTVFETMAFGRFLAHAERIVVFVLTMGEALDEAVISNIAADQLLDALFLETAGWLGIEAATRRLTIHLKAHICGDSCQLSPRLGPGYAYKVDGRSILWPLEQQRQLFGLLADAPIEVRLLESCAMMPKISRSGMYGLLAGR